MGSSDRPWWYCWGTQGVPEMWHQCNW